MAGLMRHWESVRNVSLPGDRVEFRLGAAPVGWVRRLEVPRLVLRGAVQQGAVQQSAAQQSAAQRGEMQRGEMQRGEAVVLAHPARLAEVARSLADTGAFPWRGEAFDVRAAPDGPVLTTVDRGALPWFGIEAQGVHVNGLVLRPGGVHVWVAKRSLDRLIDPGKLDHIIAGGIQAGLNAQQTLLKEGAEEAGLPETILRTARPVGTISYVTERPEGLRRDRLHAYDLWLPDGLLPIPRDGEVELFELWPLAHVKEVLAETDRFKFNVALVLIDLIGRLEAAAG